MKLSELLLHAQSMADLCRDKNIDINTIEVYFVSDVLWRSGTETESEKLLKNKKVITSTEMSAVYKEVLFFDAASWDQYKKARGMK